MSTTWGLSFSVLGRQTRQGGRRGASAPQTGCQVRNDPGRRLQPSNRAFIMTWSVQARHLVANGQYDQAEVKARQALQDERVVPALTADRAEAVLNDIADRSEPGAGARRECPPSPGPIRFRRSPADQRGPGSERGRRAREANESSRPRNKPEAASAKYIEATATAGSREMSQPTDSVAAAPAVARLRRSRRWPTNRTRAFIRRSRGRPRRSARPGSGSARRPWCPAGTDRSGRRLPRL